MDRRRSGRDYDLDAVTFSDATHGFALIGGMAILATVNGGKTWTIITPLGRSDHFLCGVACSEP